MVADPDSGLWSEPDQGPYLEKDQNQKVDPVWILD